MGIHVILCGQRSGLDLGKKDSRLFQRRGESHADAHHRLVALKLAVLLAALDGVPVSDYERDVLSWVACWETHTVAVLAALLRRARAA
jgi:hypothetical protein